MDSAVSAEPKKETNAESENPSATSTISNLTGSNLVAVPTTPEMVTPKSTGGVSIQQEEKHDTLSTHSTAEVREVPAEVASVITEATEKSAENAKENPSDDTLEGNPRIERDVDSESDKRENVSKEDTDEGKKRPRNPGEKSSERSSKRARTNSPQFSADE